MEVISGSLEGASADILAAQQKASSPLIFLTLKKTRYNMIEISVANVTTYGFVGYNVRPPFNQSGLYIFGPIAHLIKTETGNQSFWGDV